MTQCWKNSCYLFFLNPSRTAIVTFSLGQKRCDYWDKCDYYELGQYLTFLARFVSNTMMRLGPQLADDNSEALEVSSHFIFQFYYPLSNLNSHAVGMDAARSYGLKIFWETLQEKRKTSHLLSSIIRLTIKNRIKSTLKHFP